MSTVKLSIIYYSATGTNHQLSLWADEAAQENGAEVRRRIVAETAPQEAINANPAWKKFREEVATHETMATLDDLSWADAILFCMPTRYGNLPSQMQAYIDTTGPLWAKGALVNKVVSGITSSMNPQGGQESTLMALYKTMAHWGAIIVPQGYTDNIVFASGGNPLGASATVDQNGNILNKDAVKQTVQHQVKRLLSIVKKIKG